MNQFTLNGKYVDVFNKRIFNSKITVTDGVISGIREIPEEQQSYILPGFIDAHVHIESSMLTPVEFARLALMHGTIAVVSDPHEIANVCGIEGVKFMIENAKLTPLKIYFGAPSCVPATGFETAGAELTSVDIEILFKEYGLKYLSEMMNYPGVLHSDKAVLEKMEIAKRYSRPIDGHAPGLTGGDALKYIKAGISTDHECFTYEEALFKLKAGMKILIREGSAGKNFNALHKLIGEYPDNVMFCSDDKHPDDLIEGHINQLAARAVKHGYDIFSILKAACINPVLHYGLETGLLRIGDPADFIVVNDLKEFKPQKVYINGKLCAENGKSMLDNQKVSEINNFKISEINIEDIKIKAESLKVNAIKAIDGEIVTENEVSEISVSGGYAESNISNDTLKLVVINRYFKAEPAIAFIKGFGLKSGALASTVAHDSHNIIAAGVSDEDICNAVNLLIKHKGGICVCSQKSEDVLPLPIGGLMTSDDGYKTAGKYKELNTMLKEMGCKLTAPFMTLSFMALLVIPRLKLSDKGLFDGSKFNFTSLFIDE